MESKLMNNKHYFILVIFLLLTTALFGAGAKDNDKGKIVQVTGTVRLVGSGTFPQLIISASEAQWYISDEDRDKLHDLQQQTVTVEGEEIITEMRYASGRSAGTRRELRNIKIISIDGWVN